MTEVYRAVLPMLAVRLIGVLLITYVPVLSTGLPDWLEPPNTEQSGGMPDLEGLDLLDGMDLEDDPDI